VSRRTNLFGNLMVIAFLLAQASDGVLTYLGVSQFGRSVEGNPLIAWLMASLGTGMALSASKAVAGAFGIALHLTAGHRLVAALAAFYLAVAVAPWIAILFLR
jgi:hypothetical protein